MFTVFAAAYRAPAEYRHPECCDAPAAVEFYKAANSGEFPYDGGDDPAFFSARRCNGPVTWGVCRHDVRGEIQIGDWISFFSFTTNKSDKITHYRFVAALRVEDKIAQTAIFDGSKKSIYRNYLNLLVRPADTGWEHYEPCLDEKKWHKDWMWRICDRHGHRKADLVEAGRRHVAGKPLKLNRHALKVADNYVIFSSSQSVIAKDPPLVAIHQAGKSSETWKTDPRSRGIRSAVFGNSGRALRTTNRQQPHRHFKRPANDLSWLESLRVALRG